MRKLFLLVIFLGLFYNADCQRYRSAIGFRADGGRMIGFGLSQRFFKSTTAEINLDFREGNQVIGRGLFKFHKSLIGKGLTLFAGGGVHYGNYKDLGRFSGADATIGLEHKILILPFSISFELNPSVHLSGEHPDWYTFQSVFSVKYILVKHRRRGLFRRN